MYIYRSTLSKPLNYNNANNNKTNNIKSTSLKQQRTINEMNR